MYKKLQKYLALPWRTKLLYIEAWVVQLIIGLLLKVIPFRMIPRLFSRSSLNSPLSALRSPLIPGQIKQALQHTSHFSPWKNKCLISSLAARWMLNRRRIPSQLSLGVMHDENKKMIAHAWIRTGDFEVVEKKSDYQELFRF